MLASISVPVLYRAGRAKSAITDGKYIALTFDDGPSSVTTPLLLDGLKERGVPATFFVLGSEAKGREELLRRMVEEGHQIGQHSYSHANLSILSDAEVIKELQQMEQFLQDTLGEGDYWIRPPYGLMRKEQYALAPNVLITWSVYPEDWKLREEKAVTKAVLDSVQSGDIILMHDIYMSSVNAALAIVDALQAEGYTFVTVRDLMDIYGVAPEAGKLYRSPRFYAEG